MGREHYPNIYVTDGQTESESTTLNGETFCDKFYEPESDVRDIIQAKGGKMTLRDFIKTFDFLNQERLLKFLDRNIREERAKRGIVQENLDQRPGDVIDDKLETAITAGDIKANTPESQKQTQATANNLEEPPASEKNNAPSRHPKAIFDPLLARISLLTRNPLFAFIAGIVLTASFFIARQ
ncbi:hypothetical protein QBC35DRAFT_468287 [Podospora australis]|uniref:Uncharacterized protein n=1 Tax=Podospora australis TaxID=1536484 RepID=A0AAN7ADT7_9PEZI|nr:hypothetical protein QBC35DRAFT_468287 [Podospora australis]